MKNEFKCSDISFMHNHTFIRYMFSYLKQEYRVKEGLAPDKSFKKTFEMEKGNSNRSEFSKNFES